jgi:hypothetical protein
LKRIPIKAEVMKIGNIYGFTGGSFDGNVFLPEGICSTVITFPGGGVQRIIETYETDDSD